MADYKDILSGTFGKVVGRVKEAADSTGVLDVYARGTDRAKANGTLAKLSLELNGDYEELNRVYAEIGRLYYEQAKAAPDGFFVPLFEQAGKIGADIREKRAKIDALKERFGDAEHSDIEVEIGDFDDIVSAAEKEAMGETEK